MRIPYNKGLSTYLRITKHTIGNTITLLNAACSKVASNNLGSL